MALGRAGRSSGLSTKEVTVAQEPKLKSRRRMSFGNSGLTLPEEVLSDPVSVRPGAISRSVAHDTHLAWYPPLPMPLPWQMMLRAIETMKGVKEQRPSKEISVSAEVLTKARAISA